MRKNIIICVSSILLFIIVSTFMIIFFGKDDNTVVQKMNATVLVADEDEITVIDQDHVIYTFRHSGIKADIGSHIILEYSGLLDRNREHQNNKIINCENIVVSTSENGIPSNWLDEGIFSDYYTLAYNKLQKLSLDQKIGQLLLARYSDNDAISELQKYQLGGFVFYEKDFKDKTEIEVKNLLHELQENSSIPLLAAVDEEGGKVVRISSNPNLVANKFSSSQELYRTGGLSLISEDTKNKSSILKNLGINLNLAPVVDVSTNISDYIYERSLGLDSKETSDYAKTVIESSKKTGVSYTLKHFPGYGNNSDTHTGSSIDNRSYEKIVENDLPPFRAGIKAGAEAVLVSHNIVTSIDSVNPASLSTNIHNLLRNELDFTGIIITDDLDMAALNSIDDTSVKALLAGNDIIITTNYVESFNEIKEAVNSNKISEEYIDQLTFKVLAWKYYKGLMFEEQK